MAALDAVAASWTIGGEKTLRAVPVCMACEPVDPRALPGVARRATGGPRQGWARRWRRASGAAGAALIL